MCRGSSHADRATALDSTAQLAASQRLCLRLHRFYQEQRSYDASTKAMEAAAEHAERKKAAAAEAEERKAAAIAEVLAGHALPTLAPLIPFAISPQLLQMQNGLDIIHARRLLLHTCCRAKNAHGMCVALSRTSASDQVYHALAHTMPLTRLAQLLSMHQPTTPW